MKYPFRTGRKTGRAVMDADGHFITLARTVAEADLICAALNLALFPIPSMPLKMIDSEQYFEFVRQVDKSHKACLLKTPPVPTPDTGD